MPYLVAESQAGSSGFPILLVLLPFLLLAPWAGLIADRFRDCPQYFRAFISCNRPFALDPDRRAASWCGHCPKCLFVFALMAPRLGRTEVEAIFGRNLFENNDNRAGFEDIVGLGEHKPFECVGEYYEAAEVDGASKWDVFRNIMLPLARPATASVITLSLIGGLRSFDLIWAMTKGGPGFASDVIASVIYKQYQAGFYGLSTAGSVVLFLLVTLIVVPLTRWLNRGED